MPTTAAAFNQANHVVFRAKIVHSTGWHVNLAEGGYDIGAADVIDMNHNGMGDTANAPSAPFRSCVMYTEPVLAAPYATLKQAGQALNQGEILTQQDIAGVQVENFGVDFGNTAFQRDHLVQQNQRPIGSLAQQIQPIGQAGCAIDTATDEFLVYVPNAPQAPAPQAKA